MHRSAQRKPNKVAQRGGDDVVRRFLGGCQDDEPGAAAAGEQGRDRSVTADVLGDVGELGPRFGRRVGDPIIERQGWVGVGSGK